MGSSRMNVAPRPGPAFSPQRATHLPGVESAGMQPESMAIPLGGEAVGKDAREIFPGKADAGILHFDADVAGSKPADADANHSRPVVARLNGLLGVAKEIQENLQNLVLVESDGRQFLEIAIEADAMLLKARLDDAERRTRESLR